MNSLEITVLAPDMEPIGILNQFGSLRWTDRAHDFGDFTLWAPLTSENAELLKRENLIWPGGDQLGVIEVVQKTKDNDGSMGLQISGRFNECWLDRRVLWDNYKGGTAYISDHMREIVRVNAVEPSITARKLPNVYLYPGQGAKGTRTAYRAGRAGLWTVLNNMGKVYGVQPRFICNIPRRRCDFYVQAFTDRSIEQKSIPAVVLSSELSDILSFEYTSDETGYFNAALVAGQGQDEQRKTAYIDPKLSGLKLREIYVDARDVDNTETWDYKITTTHSISHIKREDDGEPIAWEVKTVTTKVLTHPDTGRSRTTTETTYHWEDREPSLSGNVETGQEAVEMEPSDYQKLLIERGRVKLTETPQVEAFNSQVRMTGQRAYTYGEDYFLGDKITVVDEDIKISVSTIIEEVEQTWDEESYSVRLTLGQDAPTIKQLIKQGG